MPEQNHDFTVNMIIVLVGLQSRSCGEVIELSMYELHPDVKVVFTEPDSLEAQVEWLRLRLAISVDRDIVCGDGMAS